MKHRNYHLSTVTDVLVRDTKLRVINLQGRDRVVVEAPADFVFPAYVNPIAVPSRKERKVSMTVAGVPLFRRAKS